MKILDKIRTHNVNLYQQSEKGKRFLCTQSNYMFVGIVCLKLSTSLKLEPI